MVSHDIPSDIVIFVFFCYLAQRKLIPSLYHLENAGLLCKESRIIGVARTDMDTAGFREQCKSSLATFVKAEELDPTNQDIFLDKLVYSQVDFGTTEQYQGLKSTLDEQLERTRIFYFATAASLYGTICKNLTETDCIEESSRVVLEKPIGHDHDSSNQINDEVAKYFEESQIYRIDHYLGKETVQNLIALRFANPIFGAQWNQNQISHVEITVAEKVGIEGRWGYFDKAGQMRDMVQNHLLQLLCLTAMDPPGDLTADMIRDEKVKVLKLMKPITGSMHNDHVVRGRYTKGMIDGKEVPGYMEEEGANPTSNTETFVSLKVEIKSWRWAGVPFYLRTGKRLPEKVSQITIHFKKQAHYIFDESQRHLAHNKLIIRLQPEEGISLQILNKDQGLGQGMRLRAGPLKLNFSETFEKARIPDAYERLLLEVIQGNQYLFVRRDEIEYAWKWCDQLLEHWDKENTPPLPYAAGSWGPKASDLMVMKDGRSWHEDQ